MFVPTGTEEIIPRRRFPYITAVIVALNSLVFVYELFILITEGAEGVNAFFEAFGMIPAALSGSQSNPLALPFYITLLTSMFVHGGLLHVASNMLYLSVFGDNVEDMMGPGVYIIFYLLCGLAASFTQIAADPGSQIPNVGASGAIAGVLAGYLLLLPSGTVRIFVFLILFSRITRVPALLFISLWFMLQLLSGVTSLGATADAGDMGGVAYWAHVGGFVAGLLLAFAYKRFMKWRLYRGIA